jgi:hypothetical protein
MAEGTDGRRIMTASEILDKIENVEPIDYDHEIIKVISILAGEICRMRR